VLDNEVQPPEREKPAPAVNLPTVVWVLIAVLLLIELLIQQGGDSWAAFANYNFAFIPARFGPEKFPQYPGAAEWSLLTYGLLHAGWFHVASNSLWLAIFSKPVQQHLGTWRYLVLLCVAVIGGALMFLAFNWGKPYILVGISGGVSGLMAGAIPLMYGKRNELYGDHIRPLNPLEIVTNRSALSFTILWLALTLVTASSTFTSNQAFLDNASIAWEAHIGGFIFGLIAFYILNVSVKHKPVHTIH